MSKNAVFNKYKSNKGDTSSDAPKVYSEDEIKQRWEKKQTQVETLANNIQSLRYNITRDLQSEDEKTFLTALALYTMDKTAERVGNEESAENGHHGITNLLKKQVSVSGNTINFQYTGKSGVEHDKKVTNEKLAANIKKALKMSKSKYLFCTSDGFQIKADRVNRYLKDFDVTAKDIRGYSANKWLIEKLQSNDIPDNEKERKTEFLRLAKQVASKVGHGLSMLRKSYLMPELEPEYIQNGKIIDLKDKKSYASGGKTDWDGKYNEVKNIQGVTNFGYSDKGNTFGTAEVIAPRFLVIRDFVIDELEKKGYNSANYTTAKSGTIYVFPYGLGIDSGSIRISDHQGRGGLYATKYDISTLAEAKEVISKIASKAEVDRQNIESKEKAAILNDRMLVFYEKMKREGYFFGETGRTYQPLDVFKEKHPDYKNIKTTELGKNRAGEEAFKYQYLKPDGEPRIFPREYVDWFEGQFSGGGEVSDKNKETYDKWTSLVNMSSTELKKFYDSAEGKEAGLSAKEAHELGIHNGRESARWILKMKDTPVAKWTDEMWEWANRQISFISRMKGGKGALVDDKGKKTRKYLSLLIWGHDPNKKYEAGGSIANEYDSYVELVPTSEVDKYRSQAESNWDYDLEKSIEDNGIQTPLFLVYYPDYGKAHLAEGHHRLDTAKNLYIDEVPLYVVVNNHREPPKSAKATPLSPLLGNSQYIKPSELGIGVDKKNEDGGQTEPILLAPNGNPSNLTPEQYRIVRTAEFKAWFGDWENDPKNSSKVVDENGEPLVMYHGSLNAEIVEFQYEKMRDNDEDAPFNGFWFSSEKDTSPAYSNAKKVYNVFLRIVNPCANTVYRKVVDEVLDLPNSEIVRGVGNTVRLKLLAIGYDGVFWNDKLLVNEKEFDITGSHKFETTRGHKYRIEKNEEGYVDLYDSRNDWITNYNDLKDFLNSRENRERIFVVFENTQIKLADGSNKTFDMNNADIRYAEGGAVDYSKAVSASSRFRPKETVNFDPPLIGVNGARLKSYTWSYEYKEEWNDTIGETVTKRISDWSNADASADTGRGIVHKYTVEMADGETKTVSAESVLSLLGYTDSKGLSLFPNLVASAKTLAKQQMKLAIMEAQEREYKELQSKFEAEMKPEIVKIQDPIAFVADRMDKDNPEHDVYAMGDVWERQENGYNYDIKKHVSLGHATKYTIELLTDKWIRNKIKENGGIYPSGLYDLRNRVERQKRKIMTMTTPKMSNGGDVSDNTAEKLQLSDTEMMILNSVYNTELQGLSGRLEYLQNTNAKSYREHHADSVHDAIRHVQSKMESVGDDKSFLNKHRYPFQITQKGEGEAFLNKLNNLVRTTDGKYLFNEAPDKESYYEAYLALYDKLENFYEADKADEYEEGGKVELVVENEPLLQQTIEAEEKLQELKSRNEAFDSEYKELWQAEKGMPYGLEKNKSQERRMILSKEQNTLSVEILNQENVVKALRNKGELSTFSDKKGIDYLDIPNFTNINTDTIQFDEETILVSEVPVYIPKINEEVFARKGYLFDAIRVDKNKYLLAVNGYKEFTKIQSYNPSKDRERTLPTSQEQGYVFVTLDQLALISDYYYTKAKALAIKEAEEASKRNEESYDRLSEDYRAKFLNQQGFYNSLPAAAKKKISRAEYEAMSLTEKEAIYKPFKRHGAKRLTSKLDDEHMWVSYHNMYERFINPLAVMPKLGYANDEVFAYWREFRDMMRWKIKDISVQRTAMSEIRKIALETSFGDSNTNTSLKDEFGILVKRQNGTEIQPIEIAQIKTAWEMVCKTFADLSNNAALYNLKISHTGDKYVFASKAVGVFIDSMHTIAASTKFGIEQFQDTLAHEVSHWIDKTLGEMHGQRWATDDYESTAGKIAFAFRKNMNEKTDSDYTNATKECFARAMEQYFAIENHGDEAMIVFRRTPLDAPRPYFAEKDYVSKTAYYDIIKPMILTFMAENMEYFKYFVAPKDEE